MQKLRLTALFFLLFIAFSKAQLVEAALNCNKSLYGFQSAENVTAQRAQSLSLPFFDDFSYLTKYPNPNLWQPSRTSVWVNRGMAKTPPSIGVATLDGLNSKGMPYGWLSATGVGCDTLESQDIDLQTVVSGDSLYFSFFYQPGGFGDLPEFADKLLVEFKNNAGNWVTVKTLSGLSGNVPAFAQVSIYVGATYLGNNAFRFRFRNLGSRLGARDHWHIDYVKLAKNRSFREPNYNDVTFFETAISPFANYTALPYKQFKAITPSNLASIMAPNVSFKVSNHFNISKTPTLSVQVYDKYSGVDVIPSVNPSVPLLTPGQDAIITPTIAVGPASYNFSNLPPADSAMLVVRYALNAPGQDFFTNQPNYQFLNDTVERYVPLTDFFAYDDGSAESSIITQNSGTKAALKFHTIVADTLQGIRMHVPAFDVSVANQLFNFSVYVGSLNNNPVYEAFNLRPFYGDSLQYWASYPFIGAGGLPPLIPANTDFYVVWEQASAGQAIPIGLDKNSPQGTQFIQQNTGGGWLPLGANVSGALMFRPFMGSKRFVNNENTAENVLKNIDVFPNPSSDVLNIKLPNNLENTALNYTITNILGSNVQAGVLNTSINIANLNTGFYTLTLKNNENIAVGTAKIIKK